MLYSPLVGGEFSVAPSGSVMVMVNFFMVQSKLSEKGKVTWKLLQLSVVMWSFHGS